MEIVFYFLFNCGKIRNIERTDTMNKDEARLYNYMMEVINQVMDNYGYDYIMGKDISKKYYTNNLKNIEVFNENNNIIEKAELISLGYYLFKRLGLEDIEISINKDKEICNLLDILDIEYLSNIDSDKLNWNYIYDDNILGMGSNNSFRLDIKEVITNLMENINKDALNRIIDVNIIENSEEESYHALKIAQDLRLNNINTLINSEYNSKFNVILNEDDLKKGIVSIRDNHLEEEVKIDEAEIIDYLLGNI